MEITVQCECVATTVDLFFLMLKLKYRNDQYERKSNYRTPNSHEARQFNKEVLHINRSISF